jgi:hypothetical protein
MGPVVLIMGFTTLLCFVVVYKLVKARQAAHWPSVEGVITKSRTRVQEESHSQEPDTVKNVAAVQYEYQVGGVAYHGKQIRAGDRFGTVPGPEILDRFPKGAKVPVYYNPAGPGESVLVTQLPYSVAGAWTFAAAVFMAGVGASLLFANLDTEMEWLRSIFPKGAEPQGVIFFGLCSLWTVFLIFDNWRQANRAKGWPTVEGRVVASKADSYRTRGGSGTQGPLVTMYEPRVEYSYVVEGREYHSTQVSFGARVSTQAREAAAERAARYPAGAKVAVHYNPEHPTVAVIETGVAFQGATIVLAAIFLGLTVLFGGVRP